MVVSRQALRAVPTFSALTDEQLDALLAACRTVTYPRAAVLFSEGDRGDSLLVVLSGQVKVSLLGQSGREVILAILGERDVLGEMALLDEESTRSATATALNAVTALQCLRRDLTEAFRNESFVRSLGKLVQDRLRDTNEQFRDRSTLDIPDRLLRVLLRLARTWGSLEQTRIVIRPRPTHEVLAQLVGCERETVTRTLKELQAVRLITVEGQSLILRERALGRLGIGRERVG